MKLTNLFKYAVVAASLTTAPIILSGCGGVSDAEMQELTTLRAEVNSLESNANTLKEERSRLEQDIADRNAKLQQCARDKEITRANLDKLPK